MNSTNKIFIILYLYICCLILSSCEKENIFDIAKEPELTDSIESVIIGDFSVEVESITDHDLYLKWYPVGI